MTDAAVLAVKVGIIAATVGALMWAVFRWR